MRELAATYIYTFSFVVEIGCGDGNFAEILETRGLKSYIGYDIDGKKILEAKKKVPTFPFFVCDIFDVYKILNSADYIVALEVFEHLNNDIKLIKKIKKDKKIIFSVPNSPYKKEHKRWFELEGWKDRYDKFFNFEYIYTIQHPRKKDKRAFLFIGTKK
jgi:2-polyprenyl-3-methyl-5-hydroxy-6-metoxy-1,4-benzoquinol methylase